MKELLRTYLESTKCVIHTARNRADQRGISKDFGAEVDRLASIYFTGVIDFGGPSSERKLTEMMLSGLKMRQATVRDCELYS
jgi:hypothetical protein